jgi:hypothetical protein
VQGDTLHGAVILDNLRDWDLAWSPEVNHSGIVIAQQIDAPEHVGVLFGVECMQRFYATQRSDQPSLLFIDEGMDFFGPTGNALHGSIVQRCFRAGGERGMSCLLGLQRPKTVSLQVLTESNVLFLFHLRYDEDVKRLWEMGFPKGVSSPRHRYDFLWYHDDELYPKPLRLKL